MVVFAVITKEDDWYVATAVPVGVTSQGKTVEEAKANLQEALELYYEDHDVVESGSDPLIASLEIKTAHA